MKDWSAGGPPPNTATAVSRPEPLRGAFGIYMSPAHHVRLSHGTSKALIHHSAIGEMGTTRRFVLIRVSGFTEPVHNVPMWIVFAIISVFLVALVNFIDAELTADNPVKLSAEKLDPHVEVGGLLLISTLMSFVGAFVVLLIFRDQIVFEQTGVLLSVGSAFPFVFLFAAYFYLLRRFPVYQVIPLFLLGSVWLLIVEISSGVPISIPQVIAVFLIIIGSYLLDTGKLVWKIPGELLLTMIPVSIVWAFAVYLVRLASGSLPGTAISFWQFSGIGVIGIFLLLFVRKYRNGFLIRIREQGKKFLGLSFLNESLSQGSYFFGNLAIAVAPAAAFVSALSGLQGVFIILIFLGFGRKVKINKLQAISIAAIVTGALLIERL